MALEQAGISLEAQNFSKYIKQLERIDKVQQEVFNVDDKNLSKTLDRATKAARNYEKAIKRAVNGTEDAGQATNKLGSFIAGGLGGASVAAVSKLTDAFVNLASTVANAFIEITKGGVALNQQAELSEKVFSNVFSDPNLGKATVDFLNETSDRLRIARDDASSFAQTILPKTGGLDEFTELLRLADIQADTTGQRVKDLEFSIREALSGDFVSLKDRFDLGTEQINRIKELTPELGRSQALITVLTEEFTRLGKTDISGTLGTNIKDLNTRFSNLQATLGKPTFEQLRIQSENLLGALDRNEKGLERTAIALGEVTSNVVELVGTELVEFIDSLDFKSIERGINQINSFVEGIRALGVVVKETFQTGIIQTAFGLITGNTGQLLAGIEKIKNADFGQSFDNIGNAIKNATDRQEDYKNRVDEAANAQSNFNSETEQAINDFLAAGVAADQATQGIDGYSNVLKQAEKLQLSFARQAEDAARKLARANEDLARKTARANEDIARKEAQQIGKLQESQAKDRDKLLKDQAKQLDRFEKDRRKQIDEAESDIREARQEAANQRKRDQEKLQRDLLRAQERFNLSQLQSERRFKLQESRLRAEGDVIGLKELREDFALQQQEEKENFDLSKKEQVASAQEQQREQAQDLDKRLKELKSNLEDQRAELLASFDEQLRNQQESQAEQKAQLLQSFQEQAAERAIALQREEEDRVIALAREEEDRRLSQARQLEDLGRSFAEQEGVTAEGAAAIADELEKVFGIDGVADSIMTGFTDKTESEFVDLFDNLEEIIKGADLTPSPIPIPISPTGATPGLGVGTLPGRIGGVQEFQEGGIVQGPLGSPQPAIVHAGETILPTHRQMQAPLIPTQTLDVNMSGGFNITGDGQDNEAIMQAAAAEITENFRIAVNRLARRN